MIVTRPPSPSGRTYLTPMPGKRVSCRSTGTLRLRDQSRRTEDPASDRLRLLHQHDPDDGRRENVEPCEGDDVRANRGVEAWVRRRELRDDDRELAVCDQRDARVQALAAREARERP